MKRVSCIAAMAVLGGMVSAQAADMPIKGCAQLKSWAMRIARRAGMSRAKVGSPADWR